VLAGAPELVGAGNGRKTVTVTVTIDGVVDV